MESATLTRPAFGKLRYDAEAYSCDVTQSAGPGRYALGTPAAHCTPCFPSDSRVQMGMGAGGVTCGSGSGNGKGAISGWVDVESDLQNLHRKATRAGCEAMGNGGGGRYHPAQGQRLLAACGAAGDVSAPDCRSSAIGVPPTEDTRLNNPPCTLRCTGWNRWEWLCQDPQDRALLPFDTLVDTSIVAKDNHRPQLACPVDPRPVLPLAQFSPLDAPAMATERQPVWAQEVLRGARATVGDGIGADGANPILAFRDCHEVAQLNQRVAV